MEIPGFEIKVQGSSKPRKLRMKWAGRPITETPEELSETLKKDAITDILSQQIADEIDAEILADVAEKLSTLHVRFEDVPRKGMMVNYCHPMNDEPIPGLILQEWDPNVKNSGQILLAGGTKFAFAREDHAEQWFEEAK
tara:strand:- start:1569 stop:1985 length:417 start_codon:yes stop_codon:yes gene_type:complete